MKKEKGLRLSRNGFTLIELLVAMVLSFILIGSIYRTFTVQQKAYTVQDQIAETQQNARMAMNILMRDLRMAGHGMPDGGITIGKPAKTYRNAIQITKDGIKQPFDSITLVGAFGAPSGHLDRTVAAGSTEIHLRSSVETSHFDEGDNRYIFIGGIDKLIVTRVDGNKLTLNEKTTAKYPTAILNADVEVGADSIEVEDATGLEDGDVLGLGKETLKVKGDPVGNKIFVDADPKEPGDQTIKEKYYKGTVMNPIPVFRVTAVEYSLDPYTGSLFRKDKGVAGNNSPVELAGNIQDIQITPDDQNDQTSYTLTLTARTSKPDAEYAENQGFRRRVLESRVALRNL